MPAAEAAIAASARFAELSRNDEAAQLAAIEMSRLGLPAQVDAVPTEHLTARLMVLNARAEALLRAGDQETGGRLLNLAIREATRLSHPGEAAKSHALARQYGVRLTGAADDG